MNGTGKPSRFPRTKVLHWEHVLASMFLRTAKCTAAGTDAEADALRVETGQGKRPRPRANGGSIASHPIAPGKVLVSFAPLGRDLSGGIFYARRERLEARLQPTWCLPARLLAPTNLIHFDPAR